MTDTTIVEDLLYAKLKEFAVAQSPALAIKVEGVEWDPAENDTVLEQDMMDARPAIHYAGRNHQSHEIGIYRIKIIGPESRRLKAFKTIAWAIRHHFWPLSSTDKAPTYGTSPLVRLGPEPPYVRRYTTPGKGQLGYLIDIYWNANLPRA